VATLRESAQSTSTIVGLHMSEQVDRTKSPKYIRRFGTWTISPQR